MANEEVYKSMTGSEVGSKLEKMMDLVDDMVVDVGKCVSDIECMTTNYEQYLSQYGQGGGWSIDEFMKSIASKSKIINQKLGIKAGRNNCAL